MRQTEEKQFNHERTKPNKKGLVILLIALVAVIALAVILCAKPISENLFKCENHIDANMDLICDECKDKIPCVDGEIHADVNNDLLCDNCGAGIASSDVSVYKEIESEENESGDLSEKTVNVRGNMPTDTQVAMKEISHDEAISLAQKFLDIESKDVIEAYDISLSNNNDVKYQPADDGEKVKVTISNLNVDTSRGLAMVHIIDEENYEIIPLNRLSSTEVEFTTDRFSTYILVDFGTSQIEFIGLGTYTVLNSDNIPLVSGVTVTNNTNFEFKILPVDNYALGDIIITGAGGASITKTAYGEGYAYVISEVSSNITVSVTNTISLTNPITLTALTDGAWTNQDVVVEIDWPVTNFTNQIKIDNGEWVEYNDPTYTMTASGTLYARVFDGDQGGGQVSVAVNNIDKVAPEITEIHLSNNAWSSGSVTPYFSAKDEGSGIIYYATTTYRYYVEDSYYDKQKAKIDVTNTITNKELSARGYCTLYIRCSDQAGNRSEIKSIDIRKIDTQGPLFSSQSSYSDADYNQYKSYGVQSFTDTTFKTGTNSIGVYNNYANGMVTLERVTVASQGIEACPVSSSGYVLKMQTKGTATPGLGGFVQSKSGAADSIFIHRFYAKIPVGYTLGNHNNAMAGTCTWLTSKTGTGEWQEYAYMWRCNSVGEFSTFGHIALNGNAATADNPVTWYIGYSTMYDVGRIWDDIDVSYGTEKAATITIRAYDKASGIKNITVNGTEVDIDTTKSTYADDGRCTMAYVSYKVTEPGTYTIIATDNVGRTSTLTRTAYLVRYNPNAPEGVTVTGTTVDQIKIGYVDNARRSKNSSTYSWKINLRSNGYTNSAGTPFRGWATSPTGLAAYAEGEYYESNGGLTLYAVWNEAIQWDVSSAGNGSVIASLITNADGTTYTLKISGTGAMKGWDWKSYTGRPWYSYRSKITKCVVENGVTNVGSYAFSNITGITNANQFEIADSVTSYGSIAFGSCSNMKGTFVISQYVTSISTNPFNGCSSLEAFSVNSASRSLKTIDGVLFNYAGTRLLSYPLGNGLTHYDIPAGTTAIATHSCAGFKGSTISIPSSLTTFEDLCFNGAALTTLSIPSTVTTLSGRPFSSLTKVKNIYYHPTNITLPHNATFTGAKAGSVIYTANRSIAQGFVDGKDYTSANTKLAYPPYFSTHPSNATVGEGDRATFSAYITDGYPTGTITAQWQYRENSSADWKNVTSTQGTVSTSGASTSFTTVPTTTDMNGYEFRCKTSNGIYPGEQSQFTEEEVASAVISQTANITIIEKNYYYAGIYFETIEEAMADYYGRNATSTSSKDGTIYMYDSVVDNTAFELRSGYKLTLETNGHTLTRTDTSVINNGTLTITGSGTITSSSDSTKANIDTVIKNNGTLTINGATIRHRGMVSSNYMAIHNATASSSVIVNSGTVSEEYGLEVSGTGTGRAIYSNVASTITVNGGTVTSRTNKTGCSAIEAYGTAKTTIYVYGGTVSSLYTTAVYITSGSSSATTESLIQAEGGTINGKVYGINYDTGCKGVLRVNGATVTGGTSGVINNSSNSETLLMTGTIDGDNVAITNAGNGPVSIKGGTVKGKTGILNASTSSARVTIYTGTIDSTEYGIHNAGAGEIRIENGTINANVASVYNSGTGTINVLGGTITSGVRGILDAGSGTINVGLKDAAISVTTPVVQGEAYGVYGETTSKINFYDGKVKGKGLNPFYKNGTEEPIDDMESGYSLFRTKEGEYTAGTLQSGWDISANSTGGTTAWAVLEQDANDMNKYKLIITATPNTSGAMKDFTTTDMPWAGYMHLIATADIQEGISNLGSCMLDGAASLVNLTIPSTITRIGYSALEDCTSISGTFTIPSGVTTIEGNPFVNSTFENFALASGNTSFVVQNNLLMNATKTTIIAYPAGSTTESLEIPSTVTTINAKAFAYSQLVNVTIPASVKTISPYAFEGSDKITTLLIPSSVTSIGDKAFYDMASLKTVYLKTSASTAYGVGAFGLMPSGSIIYTVSYDVYTQINSKCTSSTTTIYYPPKITVQPYDQELVCPDPGTFTVTVQNGNPTGITYQWYIKEPGAADWRIVTSSDGTGGTTPTFTTGYTVPDMIGTEYRCIVSSSHYPSDNFTRAEIESDTVSNPASLMISGGNFQVDGGLYYPTLQAALEGAGSGTHTISVVTDITDDSAPVIAADQVITLDMKNKTVTKRIGLIDGYGGTIGGIVNNGTLTIKNGGAIETRNNESATYHWLICNYGTLNLQGSTIRHNGDATQIAYVLENYGTFNMTSGSVEMKLNSAIASTAQYSARGITNFEGTINISGGTVLVDYNVNEANLKVEKEILAYAIEGWDFDYIEEGANKTGSINISGTANITSTGKAIVLKYDSTGNTSKHNLKISGGTITAGEYGIWTSQNAEGSIEITGGTITSDESAIMIESTNAIPVSISNATITSNNGNGIATSVDGSTVTIGTNAVITAAKDGVLFECTGTYTQTAGRIESDLYGIIFDYIDGESNINISGGTIISNTRGGLSLYSGTGTINANLSNVSITGATSVAYISAWYPTLNVYSGTYKTTGTSANAFSCYAGYEGTYTFGETGKTGPTITATGYGVYAEGNTIINSGNISGKTGVYMFCGMLSTAKLTVNAGTISGTEYGIQTLDNEVIEINGGTVSSNGCILNLAGASKATINNGTFNGQNTGIIVNDSATLTMKDGTIDTLIDGIVNNGSGTVTIENGKIYAGQYGIHHKGSAGYLTVGVDDATERVSKVLPEIRATVAVKAPNGFNFYDGILKGITTPNEGDAIDWPDKYGLYTGTETIDSKTYKTLYIAMGWNISADPNVDNVWAFLEKTETGRTLTVEGTGSIKNYSYKDEAYSNIPWSDYFAEIDKLIIEPGITSIGTRVFAKLDGITTITIPEGVTKIDNYAFTKGAGKGKTVSISSTVTSIGLNPFAATNVTTIKVASGNSFFKVIDNVLYSADGTKLVSYSIGKTDTTFVVPESVTQILIQAVRTADNLEKVVIGSNVTTINKETFLGSANLKEVYIESNKVETVGNNAFNDLSSNSIIYTKSKSVADLFVAGTNYTSANTKIYYPPVINTQPVSQTITEGNSVTFSVATTAGNPSAMTYTWQYKTATGSWTNATATQGTGYDKNTFTIAKVTSDLDGNEYRCVISTVGYPNEEMTSEELGLTSNVAVLSVNAPNYQVGSKYYNTLKEAVESIATTAETRIEVLLSNTEEDAVTIGSTQNIIVDLNDKTISVKDLKDVSANAFIDNEGTLRIQGEGSIIKVNETRENKCCIINNSSLLNIDSGTYKIENAYTQKYARIAAIYNNSQNSVTNINGGEIISTNNYMGDSVGIRVEAGKLNVYDGKIYSSKMGISNNGAESSNAEINIYGGEIEGSTHGIYVLLLDSATDTNMAKITVTGTPVIKGGTFGIYNQVSTSDVIITGGTMIGGVNGVHNEISTTIIGTSGDGVSTNSPVLIGDAYGINSLAKSTKFYDGILKGKRATVFGGDIITEAGYGLQYGTEGEYTTAILSLTNYTDGKSYYSSLQNAFEKAPSGATIKPTKDLTDNEKATLPAGKTMTLDLDGKTLTRADASIVNNGTFTITGNGSLNVTVFSDEARDFIKNSGVLNITGGNIQIDNICTTHERYMNLINSETSNSTINITGGNITAQNDYAGWAAIVFLSEGSVNISGGTLTSSRHIIAHNGANDGAKINITGGEMYAGKYVIRLSKDSNTYPDINVEVKISGTAKLESTDSVIANYSSLTDIIITGGTITSTSNSSAIYNTKSKTIIGTQGGGVSTTSPVITGVNYGVNSSKGITFYDGILKGKTAAHNGSVSTDRYYGVQYGVEGEYKTAIIVSANYYDGTSYYSSLAEAFEKAPSGATITLVGYLVESNEDAELASGKQITLDLVGKRLTRSCKLINNGSLTITNSSNKTAYLTMKAEFIQKNGTLTIDNVTVESDASSVAEAIKVTGGTLNFVSGNIYSKTIGIKVTSGTLNVGNNSDVVSTTAPMIQADGLAISSSRFNWYDGILKSKVESVYTGTPSEATHYSPDFGTETIGGVTYNTAWLARDQNYEINGNYYATLADIIAAETGGTITLIRNCTDDSNAVFPTGRSFVLDVGSLELNKTMYPINVKGILEITGSAEIRRSEHIEFVVENEGTLTLSGSIKMDYCGYGFMYNCIKTSGTLNVKDNVYIWGGFMGIYQLGGTINMYSGTVAGDAVALSQDEGTFNMYDGTLEGYADGGATVENSGTFYFEGGVIKALNKPFGETSTVQTPENHAIYYYTEGSFNCARVELGWDISENQDGSIYGYLMPNGDNYTLEVVGEGTTKGYRYNEMTSIPWYEYREKITTLTITEGVTKIGTRLFSHLSAITGVKLPNTLKVIDSYAFYRATALSETITIPKNVDGIGENPFAGAPLKNIIIENGNLNYKVENNMLMESDGKRLIAYLIGNTTTNVKIPNGITNIDAYAFYMTSATNVEIPTMVTEIGDASFAYSKLEKLIIPISVTKIEQNVVLGSRNLKELYFLGTNFTLDGKNQFANIASGSAIYTRSAAVASKFVDGTHYDSSLTTVYYPPVVGGTLLDTTVNSMKTVTFEVTVTPGVPNSVKYNWQVKRANSTEWVGLIDGQGLGTSKYTTTQLTVDNSGDEYRCIINGMNGTTEVYPNTYMPITDSDMTEKLISDTAKVYVRAANYLVNEEYFETLEDAVAAVPAGAETTIKLLTNLDDNSSVTIPANKKITLNIGTFTLNRKDAKITNNGTLSITGTGTFKVESATLVDNKGTLKITQAATNVVSTSTSAVAIINSGLVELNKLSLTTAYTAIQQTAGTLKVSGGTITANGGSSATAISGIVTSGGTVEILGGSISSTNSSKTAIGVTVQNGATLNMSAGTVSGNAAGIQNNGGTVTITGGTVSSDKNAIENLGTSGSVVIGNDDGSVYEDGIMIIGGEHGYYTSSTANLSFFDGTIKGKKFATNVSQSIITPDEYGVNFSWADGVYEIATLVRQNYYCEGSWFNTLNDVLTEMKTRSDVWWTAINITAGEKFSTITDVEAVTVKGISEEGINLTLKNGVAIDFEKTITVESGAIFNVINDGTLGTIDATVVNNGTLDLKANLTGTLTNNGTATIGATSGTLVNTVSGSITNTGAMTINKTTVTGAVTSSGSALTLNGGTLNGGVTMSSGCKFTMTSGAVNKSNGVAVTNSGTGAIEILSGAITGTTYGINNTGTGTITIGSLTNGVISSGDPMITGGTYGVKTSADFNFYDGMLRGKTGSYQGTVTAVEEGTHIKKDTPEVNGTDYHRAYIEDNDVFVKVWDISKTAGTDEVYAGVKVVKGDGVNADTRYKLVVWGTGATKDYTYGWSTSAGKFESTTPWFDVYGSSITELVLEDGVTRYGNALFAALLNVTSNITLPKTLTSLGYRVFECDAKIKGNVEIPKNLVEIGNANPFGATGIESFSVAQGNTIFEVKNEGLYHIESNRLIAYPNGSSTTKPIVAEGTIEIGMSAFYKNQNIETIILPDSLKEIKESAFDRTSIKEITIPASVTAIKAYALTSTNLLKNVYLKSPELTLYGVEQFTGMAPNSIIYTESKEIADKFIAGTTYTTANTSIYYPFKVLEMPEDFALTIEESIKIEPTIRNGNPTNDVVYQWYLNGNPIAGANSATYTKPTVEDSDSGDYQVLIKSALQEDGTYYYSHMSEKTHLRVRDHLGPESVSVSVAYLDDANGVGYAQVTVTASDTYSGVDKFYVNGTELTTGVTITNDGTGLTGGTGVAVFDIKTKGEYKISVADAEDNRTNREFDAYVYTYLPNSDYQVTGDVKPQIKIEGYGILIRECTFVKTGHTFTRWLAFEGFLADPGQLVNRDQDCTLSALWQINTYTVEFYNDAGEGPVLVESKQYNYEEIIDVPELQYHVAEMVGEDQYKIYRHKNNWKATTLDNQSVFKAEDINADNINSIWMVDSNVRYDAVYEVTTYDIGNATVYLDGEMSVSGTNAAIQNDEGVVFIGPLPTIYGPVYNNNGLIFE